MTEPMKFTFTKLNNTNYYNWKWKMQLLQTKEKNWKVIDESAPAVMTEEWKNKDASAYATIG